MDDTSGGDTVDVAFKPDTSMPQHETPPPLDETPPPEHDTPTIDVAFKPDASPPQHDTPPPEHETLPHQHETPPPEDETPPPQQDTPPSHHVNNTTEQHSDPETGYDTSDTKPEDHTDGETLDRNDPSHPEKPSGQTRVNGGVPPNHPTTEQSNGDARGVSPPGYTTAVEGGGNQLEAAFFDSGDYRNKGPSRYLESLKTLIPIRPKPKDKTGYSPMGRAGLFSFITMSWMTAIFWRAYRNGLKMPDIRNMSRSEEGHSNGRRFHRIWEEEVEKHGRDAASLRRVAMKFASTRQMISVLFLLAFIMCAFVNSAILIHELLIYIP